MKKSVSIIVHDHINNGNRTYQVDIELFRLYSLENGVGTLEGDQMAFDREWQLLY